MDVDNTDIPRYTSITSNSKEGVDTSKILENLKEFKAFVKSAREFECTHSEDAASLMGRSLELIAALEEPGVFSPGHPDVCAFFSCLWRMLGDRQAPQWQGVAVLAWACSDPSLKQDLTHTYKFMPVLAGILIDTLSFDKKLQLLTVMEELSYGIKINWQEAYLTGLLRQLSSLVTGAVEEKPLGQKALTVLVNLCTGNLPALCTLLRIVDSKKFVMHLLTMKGGYVGVQVCRLLACVGRAQGGARQDDVHDYLACALHALVAASKERDGVQLRHTLTLVRELCGDPELRAHALTYTQYAEPVAHALQMALKMCDECEQDKESSLQCLDHTLNIFHTLIDLDLFSLRGAHGELARLCVRAARRYACLPAALNLFAATLHHYKDEMRLPQELSSILDDNLKDLLAPPHLDARRVGLPWLSALGALCEAGSCESAAGEQRVLSAVSTDRFEDILYAVMHRAQQVYTKQIDQLVFYILDKICATRESIQIEIERLDSCNPLDLSTLEAYLQLWVTFLWWCVVRGGAGGAETGAAAALAACRVALPLAAHHAAWHQALNTMLANHLIRRALCQCLSAGGPRRRQLLLLLKHPHFPIDKIATVFGGSEPLDSSNASSLSVSQGSLGAAGAGVGAGAGAGTGAALGGADWRGLAAHEHALDRLVTKLNNALRDNKIENVAVSSIMQLYEYKTSCLEHRLQAQELALKAAGEQLAALQQNASMVQASCTAHLQLLHDQLLHNEKQKEYISRLQGEVEGAGQAARAHLAQLAAERADRDARLARLALQHQHQRQELEDAIKEKELQLSVKQKELEAAGQEQKQLQKKLEQQISKNKELAGVLVKFEERVKQRDSALEEGSRTQQALRADLERRDQNIKQLEKTLLERENRLYQVTGQLEEMKRVQEMVTKLMCSAKANPNT